MKNSKIIKKSLFRIQKNFCFKRPYGECIYCEYKDDNNECFYLKIREIIKEMEGHENNKNK